MKEIGGFLKAEYLMSFQSIMVGFIATEYFEGFARIIQNFTKYKEKKLYLIFMIITFFLMLIFWWNSYKRSVTIGDDILNFFSLYPFLLIFYLISILLFTHLSKSENNLTVIYFRIKKKAYLALSVYFTYDVFFGDQTLHTFHWAGLFISILLLVSNQRFFHVLVLFLALFIVSIYIFSDLFWHVSGIGIKVKSEYSRVEHCVVFLTFLFGYSINKMFSGWSNIIRNWDKISFSALHLGWTFFLFCLILNIWWVMWGNIYFLTDHFIHFLFLLGIPFFLYLITIYIFPGEHETIRSYQHYYETKRAYIFGSFMLLFVVSICISFYIHNTRFDLKDNLLRVAGFILSLALLVVKNKRLDYLVLLFAFTLLLTNIFF